MNTFKIKEEIVRLDTNFFPFPWSKNNWDDHFTHSDKKVTTLIQNKKLIGFCCWEYLKLESLCHIHKVLVLPEERGKKLGNQLLRESLNEMTFFFVDLKRCFLEVEETNDIARSLYSKMGFELLEIVPHFYGPKRNGARMMLKFS